MHRFFRRGAQLLRHGAGLPALLLVTQAAHASTEYLSRPDVRSFIEAMQAEHGLDLVELERILGEAQYQPSVVRLIGPHPSQSAPAVRSYPAYRARFLTSSRINAGAQYWETYEAHLQRAEEEFGVPAEVILGIIGVETAFGQNTGSFRVVDSLTTIAFDGHRRQEYFRDELKELLLLARETGIDPLALKGSYAGAMGLPQFMPSSYRRYAVDFDGDRVVDLAGSAADAIGSVASYLRAFGWTTGEPPTVSVQLPSGKEAELVTGLQRIYNVTQLREQGATFSSSSLPRGMCSVIELPAPGKRSKYLAGFTNFAVITQYNRSTFYAAAVLELADAIHAARKRHVTASAVAASNLDEVAGGSRAP
jgi:membrane-bound lytic murein transglycosylase B